MNSILSLLIQWCPSCEHEGYKTRIVRKSANDFACCPRCGFSVHPSSCKCGECESGNRVATMAQNGNGSLQVDCPCCARPKNNCPEGFKIPIIRKHKGQFGICHRCGFVIHPEREKRAAHAYVQQ